MKFHNSIGFIAITALLFASCTPDAYVPQDIILPCTDYIGMVELTDGFGTYITDLTFQADGTLVWNNTTYEVDLIGDFMYLNGPGTEDFTFRRFWEDDCTFVIQSPTTGGIQFTFPQQ